MTKLSNEAIYQAIYEKERRAFEAEVYGAPLSWNSPTIEDRLAALIEEGEG